MYSKEQKDIALRIYHQTESVTETLDSPRKCREYEKISVNKILL